MLSFSSFLPHSFDFIRAAGDVRFPRSPTYVNIRTDKSSESGGIKVEVEANAGQEAER